MHEASFVFSYNIFLYMLNSRLVTKLINSTWSLFLNDEFQKTTFERSFCGDHGQQRERRSSSRIRPKLGKS
jgi:hypothetical protein